MNYWTELSIEYPHKKTEQEIFENIPNIELAAFDSSLKRNLLIQSDNLIALKQLIVTHNLAGKIDLIYIDPPFATNNTFTRHHHKNFFPKR